VEDQAEGIAALQRGDIQGLATLIDLHQFNGPVQWMMWKTADGLVVTVGFDWPVSASTAFDFATHMG
jgi:hypothetical protein